MSPTSKPKSSAKGGTTRKGKLDGLTAEERAAMRDRIKEMKGGNEIYGESAVQAKIAEMSDDDRALAERVHALVTAAAPDLTPRTWYGMPAYSKDGNVLCHFNPAAKFKSRYATLGFSDKANLDEGSMWPVAFALKELTAAEEAMITELVKRAVS
jgi:uncharacterized protein YdhG (YjbR/CyaY superfamily)